MAMQMGIEEMAYGRVSQSESPLRWDHAGLSHSEIAVDSHGGGYPLP